MEKLSLIASVLSLIVAGIALYLQIRSDKNLKRVEDNTDKLSGNVNKLFSEVAEISNIQNKIQFEVEKNRLMNWAKISLPEKDQQDFRNDIHNIFHENCYTLSTEKLKYSFQVSFIKERGGRFSLPKMAYPFGRTGGFPYFCIKVIKLCDTQDKNSPVKEGEYYYLTYHFHDKNWYIGKKYPIFGNRFFKEIKIIFFGIHYSGRGLSSAEIFAKPAKLFNP